MNRKAIRAHRAADELSVFALMFLARLRDDILHNIAGHQLHKAIPTEIQQKLIPYVVLLNIMELSKGEINI